MATINLPKLLANFTTSLASGITASATSLTLSRSTDPDGTTLSGTYELTIDEGTNSEEHFYVTLAGSAGTVTRRGLSKVDAWTEVTANKFVHTRGASVKVTDLSLILINRLLSGTDTFNAVDWLGVNSISGLATPTAGETTKAANIAYVNAVSIAGANDATTTVKGIVELATAAELAAGTATGATGANLVGAATNFNATSSAAVIVPVTNSSGKLSAGFGGSASTLATLNGSSKVVEDPANATATPTASKIVIADSTSKINDGWVGLTTAGDIMYSDGTDLQRLAKGTSNQILKSGTTPAWGNLDYFVGRSAETTTGTITTSQDVSHTIACGFVPRYFEAIISGDMCQNVVWSSGVANGLGTQTLVIKGIIGGAVDWVQTTLTEASTAPNGRPERNPYFDTTGSTTLCSFGTGTSASPGSGTITTSGGHTFRLKEITASVNNIVFTWVHVNNGAQIVDLRTRVEYLHVTP